jgi:hypothetical protein
MVTTARRYCYLNKNKKSQAFWGPANNHEKHVRVSSENLSTLQILLDYLEFKSN